MNRILLTVVWGTLLAAPALAQDKTVVAATIAELRAAGVDLTGPCGALKITNALAFRQDYALLHKAGGFRAILKADGSCLTGEQSSDPEGFATDYVIDPGTGVGFDLLGDGGGANTPQWAGPENAPDIIARNWANLRKPFDPAPYLHAASVPPVVVPPPPAPLFDLAALQQQIAAMAAELHEHVRADGDAHASINQNITDGRAENRSFFGAVASHWKSITMLAGPFVTYATCRATGKCS